MALNRSALARDPGRDPGGRHGRPVLESAATIYQELIEAELTSVIAAEPHEPADTPDPQRNGPGSQCYRPRPVT